MKKREIYSARMKIDAVKRYWKEKKRGNAKPIRHVIDLFWPGTPQSEIPSKRCLVYGWIRRMPELNV